MKKLLSFVYVFASALSAMAQVDSLSTDSVALDLDALMDSIEQSLDYQKGTIELGDGMATLVVPEGFGYLDPSQAAYVLEHLWQNPPTETLGMLVPEGGGVIQPNSWAFDISFDAMGYVDDKDANEINYQELLDEMQTDALEINKQRLEMGFEEVQLIGWASTPFYEKENKVLHWAKELHFGSDSLHMLNYNIRILGRKGVLVLNAIGNINMIETIKPSLDKVVHSIAYAKGNQYDDFDPDIDQVAAYTIGGLVAGKVLAKAGVLAVLAKFGKWIVLGLIAVGGGAWRYFSGKKKKEESDTFPIIKNDGGIV